MFEAFPVYIHFIVILTAMIGLGRGAHYLVEGAAGIAKRFGVSELIVGLTVVAMGTSAPEFMVTLLAALKGVGDVSVGNIAGSNVFNLGIILGLLALYRPLQTSRELLMRDTAVHILAASLLFGLAGFDFYFGRLEGGVFLLLFFAYLFILFKKGKSSAEDLPVHEEIVQVSFKRAAFETVGGISIVLLCSQLLLSSSIVVARSFGMSEWLIGVTIVAAGTSLPELVTAIVSIIKKRHDIGIGNLIGSDIFNILGVLGLTALFKPIAIQPIAQISLAGLLGMSVLLAIFMRTGWRLSRREGFILLVFALLRWGVDIFGAENLF